MLNIKTNSKLVQPGDIFIAIKGHSVDGHDFINEAIANQASMVVVENHQKYSIPTLNVSSTKEYLKHYLVSNYASIINSKKIIGITGTNGKTTSSYLIYQMLQLLEETPAYIGTLGCYFKDKVVSTNNTTPDILDLYNLILQAIENGCETIVMEVSSHALELERVAGINFDVVAFTNLTQDHLDFHKSMSNYLQTKLKILNQMKDNGILIKNNDDFYSCYFNSQQQETISVGKSDYQILDIKENLDKSHLTFSYHDQIYENDINLRSTFNMYNYLLSVACVHNLGYSLEEIVNISNKLLAPKGRCEQIAINNGLAIVDYAHTPDAVLKVINAFKKSDNQIITIVGCGGDRDATKRPIMGNIATENSDYVIFADDNPRCENPNKIMEDIISGVNKDNYEIIPDREQAIKKGVSMIAENKILLVLGKGHEDYQIVGKEKFHFDDSEIIRKYKKSLN